MGIIIFNGISSWDYHIQVEHPPGYVTPERDYDSVHVPGRNGDVLFDRGSFQNVTRTYEIAVGSLYYKYTQMANGISEWLNSVSGYAKLEDSYEPEYYRLAAYQGPIEIENILNHAGRAEISFNCKPQRFLKVGDTSTTFTSGTVTKFRNPTKFDSLPIITVRGSGSGTLTIGKYVVKISSINSSITINSEIQDAYSGLSNANSLITLTNGFPKLLPGDNTVSFSGGITSVEVIPKWWTL